MRGLYVHIPFCVRKCAYCDFYSIPGHLDLLDKYIASLLQEAHKYSGLTCKTIYLGGGTPSLLTPTHLRHLLAGLNHEFSLSAVNEATIEANPDSMNNELLCTALECGINRISFGVQSLSNSELQSVGRLHNAAQAIKNIKAAKSAGFQNISADLMIGLPGQTWLTLKHSLERLLTLEVQHLSVYCLSLEAGTPLSENVPANLPNDDMQVDLFDRTRKLLQANGFIHYEISNFSRPGFKCQHNVNYWRGGEYLGLGPAAASHLEGIRFKNKPDLDAYLKRPTVQTTEVEQLNLKEKAEEETILRLRLLTEGVNITNLKKKYGQLPTQLIADRLEQMTTNAELIRQKTVYRLNPAYTMTSNRIFTRFLTAD